MALRDLTLTELIEQLDTDLGDATDLDKISEAQRRAHTLTDLGDRLVDHYSGQTWQPANFARFTQRAANVVVLAQDSARGRGDGTIGTEHLLLGLLGEPDGVAAQVLVELAGSAEAIIAELAAPVGKAPTKKLLPLTEDAKIALSAASQESLAFLHDYVGTEHLLLGLFAVPDSPGASTLTGLGIDVDAIRPRVMHKLGGFTSAD
ncbi:MAG TPA: Clp protease N-terminal domain-containing protein [Pseudonocardiaceae bacterium]|jgi:ATP-dependent Clp protease ATP-binding subunit ClpA